MEKTANFFDSIKDVKIALCGIGVSNTPLMYKFLEKGAAVTLCDRRSMSDIDLDKDVINAPEVDLKLGENYLENIKADIIFRTPGMNYLLPELTEYRRKGVVVTSEMEMFFQLCPCKTIAVTGSNGKTTTTTIISEFLKFQGKKVWLGGNIGTALLPLVEEMSENDVAVVELSSFQLISMRKSPDIAVITNISPNHLDVHKSMEEYICAKQNIFIHQDAFSKTVLNADDEITSEFANSVRGQTLMFSRETMPQYGAFIDENGDIFMNDGNKKTFIMNKDDIKIPGNHNVENYLAAICAVWGSVTPEMIRKVAGEFGGVEHRTEFVREIDGVKYFNDSIATCPSRTVQGTLSLYNQKIILIAGGYDKRIPFDSLGDAIAEKVKILILLGDTADEIERCVRRSSNYSGDLLIIRVNSMEQAVVEAQKYAVGGDIVSLSPACASFDMYPNFEVRGKHFKELVCTLT